MLPAPAPVFCQSFNPYDNYYALGCVDGTLRLYHYHDIDDMALVAEKKAHTGIRAITFSNSHVLYGLRDGLTVKASLGNLATLSEYPVEDALTDGDKGVVAGVTCLLQVNETEFLVGYEDGLIRLYREGRKTYVFRDCDESVTALHMHIDGDKFFALSGGCLGLFDLYKTEEGTRLIEMTAPGDGDLEAVCLVNGGLRVVCSCSSEGLAVYDPNDLEDAKNKIGGLAFSLHTCVALGDDFVITAGETGQVLVAQVSSLRWIGVFDELNIAPPTTTGEPEKKQVAAPEPQGIAANDVMALDDASSEEDEELSRKLLSVDSIVVDRAKTVAAFIDNCYGLVIFRHLDAAFRIIQGVDVGKRTNYAEFMDEL